MALIEAAPAGEMRVILCLRFDTRAPADKVAAFKRALIDCDYVLHSVEVSGGFDFIFEAGLADFAAYQAHLDRFAEPMAALVERHEANFICRRFMRVRSRDEAIWVPCRDGRRRVDCSTIDLVHAEGDYVRIHCGDHSWLLHDTMRNMRDKLDRSHFVTLHRSVIANIGFIDRLVHRHHYWVAVLGNGGEQRIAKSQAASVLAEVRAIPAASPDKARGRSAGQASRTAGADKVADGAKVRATASATP